MSLKVKDQSHSRTTCGQMKTLVR